MPRINASFETNVKNEDLDAISYDLDKENFFIYLACSINSGKANALRTVLSAINCYPENFDVDTHRFTYNKFRGQMTPLALACYHGHLDVAQLLIEEYGVNIDRQVRLGNTALHQVAYALTIAKDCRGKAQVECAKLLIEKGAQLIGDDIAVSFLDILKNHIEKKSLFAGKNARDCWTVVHAWEMKYDPTNLTDKPESGCNIL